MPWKTPESYKNEIIESTCDYEICQEIGCTEIFVENGFLKDNRWDYYGEYQLLCKNCEHYYKNAGIYFGTGNGTDDLKSLDIVWWRCRITNHDDLLQAVEAMLRNLRALFINEIRVEKLSVPERFEQLECVVISYSPKLEHFWDFSKTPNLKVLEYTANNHLFDLTELSNAHCLEYLGIETLMSNVNMNYVNSYFPLTMLKNLKEVSLSGVMCSDNNIDNLIGIPNLEKLWISPNTFSNEDFAKFEVCKFKIYDEYGVYLDEEGELWPLGKGTRILKCVRVYTPIILKKENGHNENGNLLEFH